MMSIVDTYQMVAAYKLGGNTHGKLTGMTVARAIAVPAGATGVYFQVETNNVRVRFDGTDPAASGTGFVITVGNDPIGYPVSYDMDIRVIAEAAGAALQYLFVTK